ncbi:lyase family protein [Solirubrobacter phytolaccae]|uniref:Lyase family protein n=1 Tax=Solirubrobacter phytolaccae TaxID=1404360 RepID=A0A9X3N4Q4_9ACTN|nr:lyase family protein [Solirubrobacter phytolaccae]MDA0179668.1 lyase family protein [Solirubrobacter phytolaccae]
MRPSSSRSDDVFSGVLARGRVPEHVSGRAWLQALLDFEAGLARAQARAGLITVDEAAAIEAACQADLYDVAEIGAGAAEIGNPAGAVVKALKAAVADAPVHKGATSQDAMDSAAMLVTKRALGPLLGDLRGAADAAEQLARTHRETPMIGRTLLQQAQPTTFGLKAAGWMVGLDEAADALHNVRLSVQFGGPVGTLAGACPASAPPDVGVAGIEGVRNEPPPVALVRAIARELDLDVPLLPWHTLRGRIGELAGALGVAAGAIGKAALDVVLLAQTEVGEVREGTGGGSTSMPHKHNPVAAIAAIGNAKQAPGLVATLLAAMVQEHERAAGAWHAEWRPLNELLVATGSAASWLRTSLEELEVDAERMRTNLNQPDPDLGAAATLVDRALEHR